MTAPVVEAQDLTRRYGSVTAVDGISFHVAAGEIFGLLGPNGAGKTTTILMMLGLTEISGGSVRVLGYDPMREPLSVKRRVGYLPDQVGFYDNLTAAENLAYSGRLMGLDRAERSARISDALARVRLSDVADRRVSTFSRGMRQRLGLAEILMKRAEIAILDEPTSGLDPQSTLEFLDMIRALKAGGVAIILSSHMLDQVQRVCDRVALFNSGRIALIGTVPQLSRQILGGGFAVDVEADVGGMDLEKRLRAISGVTAVRQVAPDRYRILADHDVRPDAARAVVSANGALRQLSVDEPSLEAIYSRYFADQEQRGEGVRHAA
jgi:ABC-2 type transport system ATP-binding protein